METIVSVEVGQIYKFAGATIGWEFIVTSVPKPGHTPLASVKIKWMNGKKGWYQYRDFKTCILIPGEESVMALNEWKLLSL